MRRIAAVVALVLVASGCNGGDDAAADEATTSTSTTPTTTTEATTAAFGTIDNPAPMNQLESIFNYETVRSTVWTGKLIGLIETGNGQFNDQVGRCLLLIGILLPTEIAAGPVTSQFDTPPMSLVAEGRLVDHGIGECDTTDVEAAGYDWILEAEVTVLTPYPFYAEFFLPGDPAPMLDVAVVGRAATGRGLFYDPLVLDSVPDPADF